MPKRAPDNGKCSRERELSDTTFAPMTDRADSNTPRNLIEVPGVKRETFDRFRRNSSNAEKITDECMVVVGQIQSEIGQQH
jgi:hypothetical protein